jgi:hypothetical protein
MEQMLICAMNHDRVTLLQTQRPDLRDGALINLDGRRAAG